MEPEQVVKVLWTGGWDSTFRIISLAEKNVIIEPYYLSDNRESEQNDLDAIAQITSDLISKDSTKCVIRPLKIIKSSQVEKDENITNSYQKILQKMYIGSQYDWLARFAKHNIGIELSIHKDDKACDVIKTLGSVKLVENNIGNYYILDPSKSSDEVVQVFGNFHFPLLDLSKLDMKKEIDKLGYTEIMNKTWFCHSPINNEPCGLCNPCKYTIEEGMSFRLSPAGLRRYRYKFIYKKLRKLLKLTSVK